MAIFKFEEKKNKNKKTDYQKISGIICIAVSILALFCLITHFVPFMKNFLLGTFGLFCYPFFITALAVGFALINHKKYVMPKKYGIYICGSVLFVLCILQLLLVGNDGLTFFEYLAKCYAQKTTAGGILLGLLVAIPLYILNRLGAYIIFVALSLIFIALTIDYIYYLKKNDNLKKAVKVAGTEKQVETKAKITVKELEDSLKKVREEEKPKEKVKLTLDAKIESETEGESARRKLGLLASSKQDEEDNSRYFSTEMEKEQIIDNKREYILSSSESKTSTDEAKLSRIQQNLLDLKSKGYSSYPISNSSANKKPLNLDEGSKPYENLIVRKESSMPNKVVHDGVSSINIMPDFVTKSTMETSQNFSIEETKPKFSIIDEGDLSFGSQNYVSKASVMDFKENNENSISSAVNDFNLGNNPNLSKSQLQSDNFSNKKNDSNINLHANTKQETSFDPLDVERFSSSVLASLKNEKSESENNFVRTETTNFSKTNTDTKKIENNNIYDIESMTTTSEIGVKKENVLNYQTPNNMFEEKPSEAQPIKPRVHVNYVKPPVELLTTESTDPNELSSDIVMKREELEMALDTFGIPAKVIGVVVGPAVTRYELEMPAGISIRRLNAIQDDIAYNLSSNGDIRIEAPIPGRRAVGIEVPNDKIATVGLRDVIMSKEFMESKQELGIALGKDINGFIKTFSLVKIPHLLIAGTSGSGKSVCINAIILSLIYKYSPEDLKFILIDPKRVEFSMYNNLPHLIMPNIISDSEKALNALAWCTEEMDRRYDKITEMNVKSIEEYNQTEEVLEGKQEKMPYIIFIIDELADLLMTSKKEAEDYICRILQKARACGIHMILATQRPSVDVVTGKIKTNLNARICFALMSAPDSKTVLDQGGAEKLLGRGDMLFISTDTAVPKRIQGCYVTTKEINDVVTFVKENNGDYDFDSKTEQMILNPPKNDVVSQIDGDNASTDGFDALFPEVLKSVIESGHASISMIQRKFLVGFPRAARIVDQMERAGYISPSDGSKSRSVYMTMEEYEQLYGE